MCDEYYHWLKDYDNGLLLADVDANKLPLPGEEEITSTKCFKEAKQMIEEISIRANIPEEDAATRMIINGYKNVSWLMEPIELKKREEAEGV